MSGLPIVEEINKVVYNLLASEQAVYIPTVGSLLVVRQSARLLSGRRISPPFYDVVFTSKQVGRSLPEAIARMSGGESAMAQEIYERWLSRTLQDGVLTIEGVGVLRQKSFAVDAAFGHVINPHDRTPVAVRPAASHWFVWTVAVLAVVCGVGACGWILYNRAAVDMLLSLEKPVEVIKLTVHEPVMPVDSLALSARRDSAETGSAVAVVGGKTANGSGGAGNDAQPTNLIAAEMTPERNYVVLGVFSTEANARRAAEEAMRADGTLRCGVWMFGRKFLASLFVSEDEAACIEFVNTHIDQYPEAWCHRAK